MASLHCAYEYVLSGGLSERMIWGSGDTCMASLQCA